MMEQSNSDGSAAINKNTGSVTINNGVSKETESNLNFTIELLKEKNSELQLKLQESLTEQVDNNPATSEAGKKGDALVKAGKYEEAREEYTEQIEKNAPSLAETYFKRGLAFGADMKFQDALEDLRLAANLAHENIEILNGYARLLNDLGQYEKAETVFRAAISFAMKAEEKDPLYNNLGLCLQRQGKISAARSWYEQAIKSMEALNLKTHPEKASAYNNLGLLEQELGNYNEARKWYQKDREIMETLYSGPHPDKAASYNNLGSLEKLEGYCNEARKWYQKALEIMETLYSGPHPDKATSYNNLGGLENLQGNYNEARKWYQKDREILETLYSGPHPDKAASYNNLASLELKLENYAEAWKWASKAVKMQEEHWPNTPRAILFRKNLELLRQTWKEAGGNPPTTP